MNDAERPARYRVNDLDIDVGTRRVSRDGVPVDLPGLSFDFLLAMVESAPRALDHDELADRIWNGRLVSPETITQRAKLVRDALGDSSEDPRYVALVRGHGYRLLASVEAIEPERTDGRGRSGHRRVAAAILVAGAIATLLWLSIGSRNDGPTPDPAPDPAPVVPSIAVLPFKDLSPEQDQAYFSEGLSENLIHVLAQIGGLKVIAKTSSFYFRNRDATIGQIGNALSVVYILDGGIQRSGDAIRITVRLIDTRDDSHVWSRSFDRAYTDLFAIQDEIADEVASALQLSLRESFPRPSNPTLAAFEQVIQGRHHLHTGTADSLATAEAHFQRAIELDPQYALAYVELANTYDFQVTGAALSLSDSIRLRKPLIERALEIDPLSTEAFAARGFWHMDQGNVDAAERDLLKAIGMNPSYAQARAFYAYLLTRNGRPDEALTQAQLAAELDPLSAWVQAQLGNVLWALGRVDEAVSIGIRNIRRHPEVHVNYRLLSDYFWLSGRFDESQRWILEARRRNPGAPNLVRWECFGYLDLGLTRIAHECVEALAVDYPDNHHVLDLRAVLAVHEGDWDAAVAAMEARISDFQAAPIVVRTLAHVLVQQGRAERALDLLTDYQPEFLQPGVIVSGASLDAALAFASVLHANGDFDARDRLFLAIEPILPTLQRIHGVSYGITDVYLLAMRGDRDSAIARLADAVDAGWRGSPHFHLSIWWFLSRDWRLASLHGDPGFEAIIRHLEEDIAAQRANFEATRDLPLLPEVEPVIH